MIQIHQNLSDAQQKKEDEVLANSQKFSLIVFWLCQFKCILTYKLDDS